jgi:hypothetical protein
MNYEDNSFDSPRSQDAPSRTEKEGEINNLETVILKSLPHTRARGRKRA